MFCGRHSDFFSNRTIGWQDCAVDEILGMPYIHNNYRVWAAYLAYPFSAPMLVRYPIFRTAPSAGKSDK